MAALAGPVASLRGSESKQSLRTLVEEPRRRLGAKLAARPRQAPRVRLAPTIPGLGQGQTPSCRRATALLRPAEQRRPPRSTGGLSYASGPPRVT